MKPQKHIPGLVKLETSYIDEFTNSVKKNNVIIKAIQRTRGAISCLKVTERPKGEFMLKENDCRGNISCGAEQKSRGKDLEDVAKADFA